MRRKITDKFVEWKNSTIRKPMILQGARQVGKTYSILDFGRNYYDATVYFNFETNPSLIKTFDESIEPEYLIRVLSAISGQQISKKGNYYNKITHRVLENSFKILKQISIFTVTTTQ